MSNMDPRFPLMKPISNPDLQRIQKMLNDRQGDYQIFQRHPLFSMLINDVTFLNYVLNIDPIRTGFIKYLQNEPDRAINDPEFRNYIKGTRLDMMLPPPPARDQFYAYNCYNNFYNKNTTDSINNINRDRIIPLQNQIKDLQNKIAPWQTQINYLNSKLATDLKNLETMRSSNQIPDPKMNPYILAACPKPLTTPPSSPTGFMNIPITPSNDRILSTKYPISL